MTPEESPSPEPSRLLDRLPPFALIWRGIALAGLGAVLLAGGVRLGSRGPLGLIAALPLIGSGVLAGWAALIHLTGGEEFDDMPWV